MPDTLAGCERTAYADGLAAGLAAALLDADPLAPPGRIAAVPAGAVPPGAEAVEHRLAAAEGIRLVRCGRTGAAAGLTSLAVRLAAARIGVTRRLAERAGAYLAARTGGGEPLLRKQLVVGTLADGATTVAALRQSLRLPAAAEELVVEVHDRVTALDWELAKLFGAAGFLEDGPARSAYVSRLVADCWLPVPEGALR